MAETSTVATKMCSRNKIAENDYTAKVDLQINIELLNADCVESTTTRTIEISVPFFVTHINYVG